MAAVFATVHRLSVAVATKPAQATQNRERKSAALKRAASTQAK